MTSPEDDIGLHSILGAGGWGQGGHQSRVKSQGSLLNLLGFPLGELSVLGGTVILVLKLSIIPLALH